MELFKQLASIYSGSHQESPMIDFIANWVSENIKESEVEVDEIGNIYITKGISETYPCVVAHTDQVQKPYPSDYTVLESERIICGYSPSKREYCGLGADDKCGIWIALKMLEKHDVLKVALFPGEEIGCVGSSQANMEFFEDTRFVVQADRRGFGDIINEIGFTSLCSEEFLTDTEYEKFGYKKHNGMMTDVETLKDRGLSVSCINMSCGYYKPHTSEEYIVKDDMLNALALVDNIITKCVKVYPHKDESHSNGIGRWECFRKPNDSKKHNKWDYFYDDYYFNQNFDFYEKEDGSYDKEYRGYEEQCNLLYDVICELIINNPMCSASEVYNAYKDDFKELSKADFTEIYNMVMSDWSNEIGNYETEL